MPSWLVLYMCNSLKCVGSSLVCKFNCQNLYEWRKYLFYAADRGNSIWHTSFYQISLETLLKLNWFDSLGLVERSERVHKTGEQGIVLEEARHINLSLHYLQQVIIALSDTSRTHVPYRNCALTSALRDSLGGNCMTAMVANIAMDKANLEVHCFHYF